MFGAEAVGLVLYLSGRGCFNKGSSTKLEKHVQSSHHVSAAIFGSQARTLLLTWHFRVNATMKQSFAAWIVFLSSLPLPTSGTQCRCYTSCPDPDDYCIETDGEGQFVVVDGTPKVCQTWDDSCEEGRCYTNIPTSEDARIQHISSELEEVDNFFTYVGVAKCILSIAMLLCKSCKSQKGSSKRPKWVTGWFVTSEVLQATAFMFKNVDWTDAAVSYMGGAYEPCSPNHVTCLSISVECVLLGIVSLLQIIDALVTMCLPEPHETGKWAGCQDRLEFLFEYVLPQAVIAVCWVLWAMRAVEPGYCDILPLLLLVASLLCLCCSCCCSSRAFYVEAKSKGEQEPPTKSDTV